MRFVEDGREAADGEFTHVMVRLKTAELDIVDTLIAAGIANNHAEAIRWALTRIRERPAATSSYGSTPATSNSSERVLTPDSSGYLPGPDLSAAEWSLGHMPPVGTGAYIAFC